MIVKKDSSSTNQNGRTKSIFSSQFEWTRFLEFFAGCVPLPTNNTVFQQILIFKRFRPVAAGNVHVSLISVRVAIEL